MAIIIKCAACKTRLKTDQGPCPICGGTDKRFVADFRPDGRHGRRRRLELSADVTTLAVALEIDKNTKAAIRERRRPDLAADPSHYAIMFPDLIDDYMAWYKLQHRSQVASARQDKSFAEREQSLRIVGANIDKDTPLILFDHDTASKYQIQRSKMITRTGGPVKNRTINKELSYVASYINWARRAKKITREPFKFDRLDEKRPRPIVLSPDEVSRFIDAAETFYRAFFLCLYTVGFRYSEARYLRWCDIDRSNKTIRAIQKGGTDKIEPLNPWLDNALKELRKETQRKKKHGAKISDDDYVFVIDRTGRPITDVRRAIDRTAEKAKIIKRITPHLLRHSIATHMLANGTNIRTIQAMLGHAQLSTVTWYTHVRTDDVRNATHDMFKKMMTKRGKKQAAGKRR